jgi:hypothetical protein
VSGVSKDKERPFRYEWEGILRRLALPPSVKLVACLCAQYGDLDGRDIRPGVDRLALETTYSERAVRTALAALREVGLLVRVRAGSSQGRRGLADVYHLSDPVPDDIADRVAAWNARANREPMGLVDDGQWGAHLTKGARRQPRPVDNTSQNALDHRNSVPLIGPEHRNSLPVKRRNTGTERHGTPELSSAHQPSDQPSITPSPISLTPERPVTSRGSPVDKPRIRLCPHGHTIRRRRDGTPRCPDCRTAIGAA